MINGMFRACITRTKAMLLDADSHYPLLPWHHQGSKIAASAPVWWKQFVCNQNYQNYQYKQFFEGQGAAGQGAAACISSSAQHHSTERQKNTRTAKTNPQYKHYSGDGYSPHCVNTDRTKAKTISSSESPLGRKRRKHPKVQVHCSLVSTQIVQRTVIRCLLFYGFFVKLSVAARRQLAALAQSVECGLIPGLKGWHMLGVLNCVARSQLNTRTQTFNKTCQSIDVILVIM